jgi:hypothetical protein
VSYSSSGSTSYSGTPLSVVNPAYMTWLAQNANNPYPQGAPPEMIPSAAAGQLQQFGGMDAGLYNLGNQAVSGTQANLAPVYGAAGNLAALGSAMSGEFSGNQAYANEALTNAFDPQQAEYQQQLGDVTDSTNSGLAARGLANTPYGADVQGDVIGRFQNDWQTQQIQREQMGSQSAAALEGEQLSAQQAGGQLMDASGQLDLSAASQMLQAYGLQGQNMQSALADLVNMFGNQSISTQTQSSISA